LGKGLHEAQRTIDAREFAEWMAYDSIEPGEPTRADMQAALIAATLANANRDPKKKPAPFEISDFMLKFHDEVQDTRRMSQKDIKKRLTIWKQGYTAQRKKKRRV